MRQCSFSLFANRSGGITIQPSDDNPFESPRALEEEVVAAQLATEPRLRRKKQLAPTSVVMAMLGGMFLSPLVPAAFLFMGVGSAVVSIFTMALSMFLLTKTPFTWSMGGMYFSALALFFFYPIGFAKQGISPGYLFAALAGMSLSVTIVILLVLPASRRFYFGRAKA